MGIIVVGVALATKILTVGPFIPGYNYLNWYFREASLAVYFINLPALLALVRRLCPCINNWGYRPTISTNYNSDSMRFSPHGLNWFQNADQLAEQSRGMSFSKQCPPRIMRRAYMA